MENKICIIETVGPRLVKIKTHMGKVKVSPTSERSIYVPVADENINKKMRKDMDRVLKDYERREDIEEARITSLVRTPLSPEGIFITYHVMVIPKIN